MTLLHECLLEALVTFGPILLAVLAFGLFRFWQVFGREARLRRKQEKEIRFCLQHGISASDLRAMKRYLTDLEKEVRTR